MSTFNARRLAERLRVIDASAEAIRSNSKYFMTNYRRADECVKVWSSVVSSVEPTKLLALLYVANDVAQRSRRFGRAYVDAIRLALPSLLHRVRDEQATVAPKARRVLDILGERGVFPAAVVSSLAEHLQSPTDLDDPLSASFEPDATGHSPSTPPGTPPLLPHAPSRSSAAGAGVSGGGGGVGSGGGVDNEAGAGAAAPAAELPLDGRIETRKHALATCEWLTKQLAEPQSRVLLEPAWDVEKCLHMKREDVLRNIEYAQNLVMDLKGHFEGMLEEEPELARQLADAESAQASAITDLDAQLADVEKLEAALARLQEEADAGHLVAEPGRGSGMGAIAVGMFSSDDAAELLGDVDVGTPRATGAGGTKTAEEDSEAAELAEVAATTTDDFAAELLQQELDEREAKRKAAEEAEKNRVTSEFKFDPSNPNAGKDLVWNPLAGKYTERVEQDSWREH